MTYYPDDAFYYFSTEGLKGTYILLDEPSVTGTANVLMAAVLARAKPLSTMLPVSLISSSFAACSIKWVRDIQGIGSNLLVISG
jgi:UDP-N-acetylglucosamine 1-carboxyvinyltransferase